MESLLTGLFDFIDEHDPTAPLPIRTGIFDKQNVLVPASYACAALEDRTGRSWTESELARCVTEGWLPDLKMRETAEAGFPLYTWDRVIHLEKLRAAGWDAAELRAVAAHEEWYIDGVLVGSDMPYDGDDLAIVVNEWSDQVESLEEELSYYEQPEESVRWKLGLKPSRSAAELKEELEETKASVAILKVTPFAELPPDGQRAVRKAAAYYRHMHEMTRVWMLEQDRQQALQGYSPWIQFSSTTWERGVITVEGVMWNSTLRSSWAWDTGVPLRLPGGIRLDGENKVFPRMTLSDIQAAWATYQLDEYQRAYAKLAGSRICLACFRSLGPTDPASKRYCSDTCKHRAKMSRYRQRRGDRPK